VESYQLPHIYDNLHSAVATPGGQSSDENSSAVAETSTPK